MPATGKTLETPQTEVVNMPDARRPKDPWAFLGTPKAIAIIAILTAAISGAAGGWAGYSASQRASMPTQIIFQPGLIVLTLPATAKTNN